MNEIVDPNEAENVKEKELTEQSRIKVKRVRGPKTSFISLGRFNN